MQPAWPSGTAAAARAPAALRPAPGRLLVLDGLRGMAAIMVVCNHINWTRGTPSGFFKEGQLAVDLFFILSGFVLTLAFERKFGPALSAPRFMALRIKRLYPAIAAGTVIGTIWAAANGTHLPLPMILMIAMALTMIPSLVPDNGIFPLNPPQWSLFFELFANLLHALVLYRLPTRALLTFCLVCGAVLAWQMYAAGTIEGGWQGHTFWSGFARTGYSYALGILFARSWRGEASAPTRHWWAAMIAPVALICAAGFAPDGMAWVVHGAVVFIGFPLAFQAIIHARAPEWSNGALHWLGSLSYPIYAIHMPIILAVMTILPPAYPHIRFGYWNLVALIAALAAAQAYIVIAGSLKAPARQPAAA